MIRLLMEYWDEGGTLQWFAQTCPELGTPQDAARKAAAAGAAACYIHGGVMDNWVINGMAEQAMDVIDMIRDSGMVAGAAGHLPATFTWAKDNIDVDFFMCSYYNPIARTETGEHRSGTAETYLESDRTAMTEMIQTIRQPVIHYKILAAGRHDPEQAIPYTVSRMRDRDALCVGIYANDAEDPLGQDVETFLDAHARLANSSAD